MVFWISLYWFTKSRLTQHCVFKESLISGIRILRQLFKIQLFSKATYPLHSATRKTKKAALFIMPFCLKVPYLSNVDSSAKLHLLRLIVVQEKNQCFSLLGVTTSTTQIINITFTEDFWPHCIYWSGLLLLHLLLKYKDILNIFNTINDYRYTWHFDFALQPHSEEDCSWN